MKFYHSDRLRIYVFFNVRSHAYAVELTARAIEPVTFEKRNPLDLVIFCGSPGAGKSTFYWKYLQPLGYERVNQDILKTVCVDHSRPWLPFRSSCLQLFQNCELIRQIDIKLTNLCIQRQKCIKVAQEHLAAGRSVAVGM